MSGTGVEPARAVLRHPPLVCARCGASVAADQSWCVECGLAARTRMGRTPNWRAPLYAAGAVGLAAIVALVVAFLVLTGDNAPLPTTATTAPPAAATAPASPVAPPTTVPAITTTTPATPAPSTAVPTATIPPATAPAAPPTPTTATESTGAG